jgi:hypothetical protein
MATQPTPLYHATALFTLIAGLGQALYILPLHLCARRRPGAGPFLAGLWTGAIVVFFLTSAFGVLYFRSLR